MTRTYYGISGVDKSINCAGNEFLGKLTLGLWDQVDIPMPLSEKDSLLVARMLRNYAKLQIATLDNNEAEQYFFWNHLGYEQENMRIIKWIEGVAQFFEESGGLLSEEEGMARLVARCE